MRRSRSAKQCVWLGEGRYFGRRERGRHANADAHCDGDSNAHCHADRDCNSIADSYAASDPKPQRWSISKAAPHASAQAIRNFALKIPGPRFKSFG